MINTDNSILPSVADMATRYACPFESDCETDCSRAEVGEFFRLVVNPRSRQLLSILETHEGDQLTVDDVLGGLQLNGMDEKRTWRTKLHHVLLPMFEELGIAAYNRNESTVRYLGCPLLAESTEMMQVE